ncbi:MAG: hypothetical protein RLZ12_913 [Bacillota bacterium]
MIKRKQQLNQAKVIFSLLGLIRYKILFPKIELQGTEGLKAETKAPGTSNKPVTIDLKTLQHFQKISQQLLEEVVRLQEIIRWFLSKVTCEKLTWKTAIGTGSAEDTGVITGLAWGIKNMMIGMFAHYIRWQHKPFITVNPSFNKSELSYSFHSILRFKIGYAIWGLNRIRIQQKGGVS